MKRIGKAKLTSYLQWFLDRSNMETRGRWTRNLDSWRRSYTGNNEGEIEDQQLDDLAVTCLVLIQTVASIEHVLISTIGGFIFSN